MGHYDVLGAATAKFLDEIELAKAKEIMKLIRAPEVVQEGEKVEDKEKKEDGLVNNPLFGSIQSVVYELVVTVIGEREAAKKDPGKNERSSDDLAGDFIDDFQGMVEAKDREDNLTEMGNDIKKILEKTVVELRSALKIKAVEPSKPKKK